MPGRDRGGVILTTLLGIVGAILGTFLGQTFGFYAPGESAGFLMSIRGSVILFLGRRLGAGSEQEGPR